MQSNNFHRVIFVSVKEKKGDDNLLVDAADFLLIEIGRNFATCTWEESRLLLLV